MTLRRMGITGVTVHGFRSVFRDWAGNKTSYARELAEHALAHVIGDRAEQAYRRDDALERRRPLMESWSLFCVGEGLVAIATATRSGKITKRSVAAPTIRPIGTASE
jgi:hypothetical protein